MWRIFYGIILTIVCALESAVSNLKKIQNLTNFGRFHLKKKRLKVMAQGTIYQSNLSMSDSILDDFIYNGMRRGFSHVRSRLGAHSYTGQCA